MNVHSPRLNNTTLSLYAPPSCLIEAQESVRPRRIIEGSVKTRFDNVAELLVVQGLDRFGEGPVRPNSWTMDQTKAEPDQRSGSDRGSGLNHGSTNINKNPSRQKGMRLVKDEEI
ncbi:hypothetical protein EV424DRAFT_1344262 [Suillus variegatus]|nr:hypothetical protein EV424DRAFT_1344262 [Suillus variegatus]